MEIGPLYNTISDYVNVDIHDGELMRDKDNYYTVKLKRYKEKATEDRTINHVNFQVEWNITTYVRGSKKSDTLVEFFPSIVNIIGTIGYEDYVNAHGASQDAEKLLTDIDVELDEEIIEYEFEIDCLEDGWQIEHTGWSDIKMGENIEPTGLEIYIKEKKILVIFESYEIS